MGREFELKYRLNPEAKEEILKKYGDFRTISMETTYYDTAANLLQARRWTLRRRLENGVSVCTVKIPLPDGAKGEWETEDGDIAQGVKKLIAMGAPIELAALIAGGLVPTCGARFTRCAKDVFFGESRMELALDEGKLFRREKEIPLLELEVELKDGKDTDAVAFAAALAAQYGLAVEQESKFKRARSL